jgi:formylmethanofuran dehydrogenase subunit D
MTNDSVHLDIQLIAFEDVHLDVIRQTHGWDSQEYQVYAGVMQLSPTDLKKLGLKNGDRVRLTAAGGAIVAKVKSEVHCSEGTGWLPASLYSNRLAAYDPSVSQIPSVKVMRVSISPTQDEVTPIWQVLQEAEGA